MENIFATTNTVTLIKAVEQMKPPASYLIDTFFPNKLPTANTSMVALEFRKGKRRLAPYIVRGGKGINIARESAKAGFYAAPMTGPRRVISIQDIEMRIFGEQPIFTQLTPEERAAQLQAKDLSDLIAMSTNRHNKIAADILQTGQTVIKGYADDGQTIIEDIIDFQFEGAMTPPITWDNSAASIYDDLRDACDRIAEETGELPTMLLCGKNVEKYLLGNKEILKWLSIPNGNNLSMASLQPKYIAPQARYIGTISSLGLEIYSYLETYFDDETKTIKPFIDLDIAIVANPKRGMQLTGAVTLLEGRNFRTYAAEYVPKYSFSETDNQISLTVYSRWICMPENLNDWVVIHCKGE